MSQHDYILANQSGAAFRADLNDALGAIVTQNSGATAPATTYAYMPWADTTTGLYKIRNAANSGWITLYQLDGEWSTLAIENGSAAAPSIYFKDSGTDTGFYSSGTDAIDAATGGTRRWGISSGGDLTVYGGNLTLNAQGDLRFADSDSSNWVAFQAPATVASNITWTLPSTDGTSGQTLTTNGSGVLSWVTNSQFNRIINGGMAVDQRNAGAAQTFTAGAALAYSVDRWYGYCTGANVTGQRVAGASAGQFRYQFTGAASVTAIGFGQRIEQLNSADLASTTATLSVDLANSVLTTVTWTAYYATTADTFGTLASPTRTQIATGTFTVTSTVTRYNTNISIPAAATTGIEIVFTIGAQTSGTWTIGNVQLEAGSVATPFERRSYGQELALCQRYYESSTSASNYQVAYGPGTGEGYSFSRSYRVEKRIASTPSATFTYLNSSSGAVNNWDTTGFYVAYNGIGGAGQHGAQFSYVVGAEL